MSSSLFDYTRICSCGGVMNRAKKLVLTVMLVLLLVLGLSCSVVPQGIQNLFASKTPTPTNTSTPTATSTSTPTATSTPTNPLSVKPCFDVDQCWTSEWIDSYIEESVYSGEIYRLSIPYDQSERMLTGWSAIDEATLQENLTHIKWIFRIDGQDYFNERMLSPGGIPDSDDPSIERPGMWLDVSLSGWKLNQPHTVEIGYTLTADTDDGWYEYEAGYQTLYTFIVTPSDLPTATPTATVTLTPTPRPTAVPYTKTPKATLAPTNPPCEINSSIEIDNTTGGYVTLKLSGPMSYSFDLATGITTLKVCSGSYSYKAWGCGGATDSGTINSGEAHEFYCN